MPDNHDDNPMSFFKNAKALPQVMTRAEAGHRAVDTYRDRIDQIPQPEHRQAVEAAIRRHAEKSFDAEQARIYKDRQTRYRIEDAFDHLSPKNPVRIAAEHVYSAVLNHQNRRLGATVLKDIQARDNMLAHAQKTAGAIRARENQNPQRDKERDR